MMPFEGVLQSQPSSLRRRTSDRLPADAKHHLIVTTAQGVYTWNSKGTAELFSSHSNGIVTSRKMQTDKDLLAVADSQVVILHDVEKGMQRTYRLRRGDQGQIRKLFYHSDKQRLFFTTTLQNAVQTFSLQTSELLDAGPVHPSPPTVFAVSPACDLMVSASLEPPTIYLSRIAYKQPPLLFIPNCSTSPVVAIAFHPTRVNVFTLGFEDGTVAVYDATVLPISQVTEERYSYARIYGEISHRTGLHELGDLKTAEESPGRAGDEFVSRWPTISALEFLSDQPCSVVSIGSDGKCCIVSFEGKNTRVAKITQQWLLKSPATCLAILTDERPLGLSQVDGADDQKDDNSTGGVLLAIGKADGTVSIYNRSGELLATRDFSRNGRVLDLEWMQRSRDKFRSQKDASHLSRHSSVPELSTSPHIPLRNSRSSIGSKIMVKLHTKEPPPENYLLQKQSIIHDIPEEKVDKAVSTAPIDIASKPPDTFDSTSAAATKISDHGEGKPITKDQSPTDSLTEYEPARTPSGKGGSCRASQATVSSRGSRKSTRRSKLPYIPQRPVPRPGGKLALRRMESAKSRRSSSSRSPPIPKEIVRAVTTGQPKFGNINHTKHQRPQPIRHRSSKVSPLSEKLEPRFSPITPNQPIPSPTTVQPYSLRAQTALVQYDRLTRASWDAESTASASKSSVALPTRRRPDTPSKSKLVAPSSIKLGTAPIAKAVVTNQEAVIPVYLSDSGTSVGSVLDWTPAQVHHPTYVPNDIKVEKGFRSLREPVDLRSMQLPARNDRPEQTKSINSEESSASQMDWYVNRKPIIEKPSATTIRNPQQSNTSQEPDQQFKNGNEKFPPESSIPMVTVAPQGNIPRLRKQETVINLRKQGHAVEIGKEDQDPVQSLAGEVVKPRLSDPGPTIVVLEDKNASAEAPQPIAVSASAPQSATSPVTRRSSQFRALTDFPHIRSGSTIGSQSMYTIEDVVRVECAAICARIDMAFEEQKAWLQGFLRDQNWYAQRLEEENRQFREELARLRKA